MDPYPALLAFSSPTCTDVTLAVKRATTKPIRKAAETVKKSVADRGIDSKAARVVNTSPGPPVMDFSVSLSGICCSLCWLLGLFS